MKLQIADWRETDDSVRVVDLSAGTITNQRIATLFVGAATEAPSESKAWQMSSSPRVASFEARTNLRVFEQTELMTVGEIHLLRESFHLVAPLADSLVEAFRRRLFELEPELFSILAPNFGRSGRKLMQRLSALICMLERPHALVSTLECLARELADRGVSHEHYDKFAEALLLTLERGLGPVFSPEVQAAWNSFCEVVSTIMKDAPSDETTHFGLAEAVAC